MKTALILVGGKGTRLQQVYSDHPKPLVPVGGKPFLDRLLDRVAHAGIERVVLMTGYKSEMFISYRTRAADFDLKEILISEETGELGSAGAIKNAEKYLTGASDFFVFNGDTFVTDSANASGATGAVGSNNASSEAGTLRALKEFVNRPGNFSDDYLGDILLVKKRDSSRYGAVVLAIQNAPSQNVVDQTTTGGPHKILSFNEKSTAAWPESKNSESFFINAGVWRLSSKILGEIPVGKFVSIETEIFKNYPQKFNGIPFAGDFIDIGIPESYSRFSIEHVLKELKNSVKKENSEENHLQGLIAFKIAATCAQGNRIYVIDRYGETVPRSAGSEEFRSELSFENSNYFANMISLVKSGANFSANSGDLVIDFEMSGSGSGIVDANGIKHLNASKVNLFNAIRLLCTFEKEFEISKKYLRETGEPHRPALFLDRDGVVIELVQYISDPKKVILNKNVLPAIKKANSLGVPVLIITNQSGIGRGLYSWLDYDAVTAQMKKLLAAEGAWIDDIESAAFIKDSVNLDGFLFEEFRKPNCGMLLNLAQKHRVDLSRSVLMGDRALDLQAGYNAGLSSLWLVQSDETVIEEIPKAVKFSKWPSATSEIEKKLETLFGK